MTDPEPERLAFSLELLANPALWTRPVTACPDGHLKVNLSCWAPLRFSPDLKTLLCEQATHDDRTET